MFSFNSTHYFTTPGCPFLVAHKREFTNDFLACECQPLSLRIEFTHSHIYTPSECSQPSRLDARALASHNLILLGQGESGRQDMASVFGKHTRTLGWWAGPAVFLERVTSGGYLRSGVMTGIPCRSRKWNVVRVLITSIGYHWQHWLIHCETWYIIVKSKLLFIRIKMSPILITLT